MLGLNVSTEKAPKKFMLTKSAITGASVKRTVFDGVIFGYLLLAVIIAFYRPAAFALEDSAQLATSFQIFLVMVGLGAAFSVALNMAGQRTLGEMLFAPPHRRHASASLNPWYKTTWGVQTLVAFVVTLVFGFIVTKFSFIALLEKESVEQAFRLFTQLAQPDWTILNRAILKIIETIFIAFMATIMAVPVAFVLSFLCAKNIMGKTKLGFSIYATLRLIFNVSRSIEPILWAIIFSVWVGFGPFAGMLALMIHSVASLSKQYSEIVETVEDGPIEGIESTGAGRIQTIWFAIVPQIILPHISYTIYRWDINVRMATIIGFVGGGGIGTMLLEYQGQARWPQVGTIIVVIAFVVWVMDTFSAYVREAVK